MCGDNELETAYRFPTGSHFTQKTKENTRFDSVDRFYRRVLEYGKSMAKVWQSVGKNGHQVPADLSERIHFSELVLRRGLGQPFCIRLGKD